MISSRFMLFPKFADKNYFGRGVTKMGGQHFFIFKQFFLISFNILCYFQHLKKNLKYRKVPLHLLVKWEVVSTNSI